MHDLSTKQLAEALGMKRPYVLNLVRRGLPHTLEMVRGLSEFRYDLDAVRAWIEAHPIRIGRPRKSQGPVDTTQALADPEDMPAARLSLSLPRISVERLEKLARSRRVPNWRVVHDLIEEAAT